MDQRTSVGLQLPLQSPLEIKSFDKRTNVKYANETHSRRSITFKKFSKADRPAR